MRKTGHSVSTICILSTEIIVENKFLLWCPWYFKLPVDTQTKALYLKIIHKNRSLSCNTCNFLEWCNFFVTDCIPMTLLPPSWESHQTSNHKTMQKHLECFFIQEYINILWECKGPSSHTHCFWFSYWILRQQQTIIITFFTKQIY